MASFVMLETAKDNEAESPRAAVVLSRDRYMDDLIHSFPTVKQALDTMEQINRVLSTGRSKSGYAPQEVRVSRRRQRTLI